MSKHPKSIPVRGNPSIHPDCGPASRRVVKQSFLDKKNIKDGKGFSFDIIVVRLDIPNKTIDESSKLSVDVNLIGKSLSITSSRINVLDFQPQRSIEFDANPLELKTQLSKNPLNFKVTEGFNVIGYGTLEWPDEFLSGLTEGTGEVKNSFEIELMQCNETKVGMMQVIVRLQPKCEEYEEDTSPDGKCRNANKEIDPNDVLFVVGEDKNNCCCSQIGIIPPSDSDHNLQPTCLDLTNFRAINSQNVESTCVLDYLDPACEKLKIITNHYQTLIDAVNNTKMEKSYSRKGNKFPKIPCDSCLEINVHPSSSDSYRMPIVNRSDKRAFAAENFMQLTHIENPPELTENEPQSLRCCPICKENMEYLPKLAACPNCCYKPIPRFEEKPYNYSQNANQVLKKFQDKLRADDISVCDTNLKDRQNCRCTCKYGSNKPCAHCRIRKLCEHIFQPPLPTLKPGDNYEAKSSDVDCVSSSNNRPFLSRIFAELKDIYDIEDPIQKQIEVDKRCERELNREPFRKKVSPLKKGIDTKVENCETDKVKEIIKPQRNRRRRKRSIKPASELAVKSRLYDYQLVQQHFATQKGHKTCINGFAGRKNVPPNMGWLWNIHNSGKWKPGTIRKPIKELMRYFLKDFPADTLLVSQYSYRKKSKSNIIKNPFPNTLVQKPTLHIHKKNGEFIITMRPLKPLADLKDAADPYENMKPVQFRIIKKPNCEAIRNLKKYLKSMGFKKCTCHRPIAYCYCRSFLDKKKLEYRCNEECFKRQIESCCDTLVLTDTSDSEAEFDFGVTPPIGIIKPERLNKINLVNVGTQYDILDWNAVLLFPRPPNKYMQPYLCAAGERKVRPVSANVNANGECIDGKAKGADGALRKGNFTKAAIGKGSGTGDGLTAKGAAKGGPVAIGMSGKHGGRGEPHKTHKKVNMLKYVIKMDKKVSKLSHDAETRRKEKMKLLKGATPPILCTIDRRGKPLDPCAPCLPPGDYRIC